MEDKTSSGWHSGSLHVVGLELPIKKQELGIIVTILIVQEITYTTEECCTSEQIISRTRGLAASSISLVPDCSTGCGPPISVVIFEDYVNDPAYSE